MASRKNRYKQMEEYMTYALVADAGIFVLYLIFAGYGIIWLKVICSILCILLSAACLGFLYLTQELLRRRSLWMSAAAAAVLVCTLFSLLFNFPSPNKYKRDTSEPVESDISAVCILEETNL